MNDRAVRFFRALLARRRGAFAVLALVLVVSGAFASRVVPSYDAKGFLPSWDARRQTFEAHAAAFPLGDRRVSVFVESATGALDAATFAQLTRVADALTDEGLTDVTWLGNVELADADPDEPFALRVHAPLASGDPVALMERRRDGLLRGRLWNDEARAFVVHATLPEERDDPDGQLALETSLEERLAELRAEGAAVRVAGLPILKARGFRLVQSDTARFLGLGGLLVGLLLFGVLRELRVVLAIGASLFPACLATLAVMGATDTPVSALTSFVPLLVLIVGVCDALHLVAEVRERRRAGLARREAIAQAFGALARSCFFTSLTTALGFASLLVTGVAIVVELALFTALAVGLTFVFSMLLLPLLLDTGAERPVVEAGRVERFVERLTTAARAHALRPRASVLGAFALLVALAGVAATGLRTNGTMIDDVDAAHPLMRDLAWLEREGFGVHALDLWLRAEDPQVLAEPATIAWMERTSAWLSSRAPVRSVVGPHDHLHAARRALALEGPPASREEVAQVFLLLEMADPAGLDEVWRPQEAQAQLVASVVDLGSARMGPFFEALEARLEHDPPPDGVRVDPTGTLRLAHVALADIVSGFGSSLALAALLVWLLMSVMMRSALHGLVALIPNALPLLAMLGAMGAMGADVKPSTLLVFSVAFGIAVDDTLHLVGRVRERLAAGDAIEAAIDEALRSSGRAIVLTSVVLGGGFVVLVTSEFVFLSMVGAMTALSVVVALLADLFVYPALLRWTMRAAHVAVRVAT